MVVLHMRASPTATALGPVCKFYHFEALLSPTSGTRDRTADPGTGALSRGHDLWSQCRPAERGAAVAEMVEIKTRELSHKSRSFKVNSFPDCVCCLFVFTVQS